MTLWVYILLPGVWMSQSNSPVFPSSSTLDETGDVALPTRLLSHPCSGVQAKTVRAQAADSCHGNSVSNLAILLHPPGLGVLSCPCQLSSVSYLCLPPFSFSSRRTSPLLDSENWSHHPEAPSTSWPPLPPYWLIFNCSHPLLLPAVNPST